MHSCARILIKGLPSLCKVSGKEAVTVDTEKTKSFFGLGKIMSLKEAIERIVAREYLLMQNDV